MQAKILKQIVILGAGGSGSWVGLFAAHIGVESIIIFDGDTVDERDINNKCSYGHKHLGKNKSDALKEIILEINPSCKVLSHNRYFDLNKDYGSLVDGTFICLDDINIIKSVSLKCNESHFTYVIPPYSKFNAGVFNQFNSALDISPGDGTGWVGSCAMAGLLGCCSMFTTNFEMLIDIEAVIQKKTPISNSEINKVFSDGEHM